MKHLVALTLAGFALAGCAAGTGEPAELSATAQSRLAAELDGRVADAPVSCVSQRDLLGNRSIGEEAILFEGRGGVLYVNRPPGGCPDLRFNRALITRTPNTRLCQGDIATVFDTVSRVEYGGCGLGEFTPYRRVR